MQIEVRESNIEVSESLREHLERKLALATRRFLDEVDSVVVRMADINGPRGGADKRCRLVARLADASQYVVEATDADAYAAVTTAAARLDDRISRAVSRRRLTRTGRRARSQTIRHPEPAPASVNEGPASR